MARTASRIYLNGRLHDNRDSRGRQTEAATVSDAVHVVETDKPLRYNSYGVSVERENARDTYPWWRVLEIETRWI